jgi:UDP-N-acetylmuramoylalanine--D-glutamate ligase
MDIKSKKFGIFGLGLSGLSAMKYLAENKIDFIAYDDQEKTILNISSKYLELADNLKDLSSKSWQAIDYLILSPGIALTYPKPHKVVEIAKKIGAKIICDIELLYLQNKDNFFIGITGTNGKSTTTALITHILKYNGVNAILGGNIGVPVLGIKNIDKDAVFVIEASSFQLDLLDQTKFNIALLLNITPDHLDRHGNMENYTESKYKIFNHQIEEDVAVINADLKQMEKVFTFSEKEKADVSILDNILYYAENKYEIPYNNSLLGAHNQQNLAASVACCLKYGLKIEQIISAIPSFVGLKHRMQYLGQHQGIRFINDSKATNADSTEKALASFENIIWIAGGVEKEGGIESLKGYFPKIKQVLLIGKSQDNFAKTCGNEVAWQKCDNMANAFKMALEIAKPGDVVLLSPACASYDQWKNFEERGDAFIKMVEM